MDRAVRWFIVAGLGISLSSCGPGVPPPEAVLAGDWEYFLENGTQVVVTFNGVGVVTGLSATRSDGAAGNVLIRGATTRIDEAKNVRIELTLDDGERIFTGVLTTNDNVLDGTMNREIRLEGETIIIPTGTVTFQRILD